MREKPQAPSAPGGPLARYVPLSPQQGSQVALSDPGGVGRISVVCSQHPSHRRLSFKHLEGDLRGLFMSLRCADSESNYRWQTPQWPSKPPEMPGAVPVFASGTRLESGGSRPPDDATEGPSCPELPVRVGSESGAFSCLPKGPGSVSDCPLCISVIFSFSAYTRACVGSLTLPACGCDPAVYRPEAPASWPALDARLSCGSSRRR